MLHEFEQNAARQHLFPSGRMVLLAVSGGRDSMCLSHLMYRSGIPFAIAHCNFHLRGVESDRDQQFVCQWANRLNVPFHTIDFDTHAYASLHHLGIEEAARKLRYRYFATLCKTDGYPLLATAHHRDDSVETLLLNLFRGTGIAGLHGIRPVSDLSVEGGEELRVVRPLLPFTRAEIDSYMERHNVPYVDDSSNAVPDVRRNRIRLQLLPLLRDIYPQVDAVLADDIERFMEAEQVYRTYVDALVERLFLPHKSPFCPPYVAVPLSELAALQPRRTLLFELLSPYGFSASTIDELSTRLDCPRTGSRFLSPTTEALFDRTQLLLLPRSSIVPPTIESTEVSIADLPPLDKEHHSPWTEYIDADAISMPLSLRLWRAGDRFSPLGMSGSRLVSDYLKDRHLSLAEKRGVYLVEDAMGRPVWLLGLCIDHRVRITPSSRRFFRIEAHL